MTTDLDEVLQFIDDLTFVETKPKRYRWSRQEDAYLKQHYGRMTNAVLAEKMTDLLRSRTGDPNATRSLNAVSIRALALGVSSNVTSLICVSDAVRQLDIPFDTLNRAITRGDLVTVKIAKNRYIHPNDLAIWALSYRSMREAQSEMLQATEGCAISKVEAMQLTGLGESQITRYLKSGVIQAWLMPEGSRGVWLVDRRSAQALADARQGGYLKEYLGAKGHVPSSKTGYPTQERSLKMDTPASKYHPGCFTVAQVGGELGATTYAVYKDIRTGNLKVKARKGGGRLRYAVAPPEARRYVNRVLAEGGGVLPHRYRLTRRIEQAHQAGLLTVYDLTARWNMTGDQVEEQVRQDRLKASFWGNMFVFKIEDVEQFEKAEEIIP